MATATTPPPGIGSESHSTKRPVEERKVPVIVKPSPEEQTQLPEDRVAAVVTVLLVVGMIALAIWAALTGDTSKIDAIWDSYLN